MDAGMIRFLPARHTGDIAGAGASGNAAPTSSAVSASEFQVISDCMRPTEKGSLKSDIICRKLILPGAAEKVADTEKPLPDLTSIRNFGYKPEFDHGPIESAIRSGVVIWMRNPEGGLVPLCSPEQPGLLEKIRNRALSGGLKESMDRLASLAGEGWSFYRIPPSIPHDPSFSGRELYGMKECRLGAEGVLMSLQGNLPVAAVSRDGRQQKIMSLEELGALKRGEIKPLREIAGRSLDILEKNGFIKSLKADERLSQIESLSMGKPIKLGRADRDGIHNDYTADAAALDSFAGAVESGKTLPGPSRHSLKAVLKRLEAKGCVARPEPGSNSFAPYRQISVNLKDNTVDLNLAAQGFDYENEDGFIYPGFEGAKLQDWERLADILEGKTPDASSYMTLSRLIDQGYHLSTVKSESPGEESKTALIPRSQQSPLTRPLNAPAALLRLEKGLAVVLEAPDGRTTVLKNVKDCNEPRFKENADPERTKLGDIITGLELKGVHQHYRARVVGPRQYWINYENPPLSRSELLNKLQKGEAVEFYSEKQGEAPSFYELTAEDLKGIEPFLGRNADESKLKAVLHPRDRLMAEDLKTDVRGFALNMSREKAREYLKDGRSVYLLTSDGHAEILEKPSDLEEHLKTGKLPENPSRWIHREPAAELLISVHGTFFQPYPIANAIYTSHLFHQMEGTLSENNDHLAVESLHNSVPEGPLRREEVLAGDRKLLELPKGRLNDPEVLSEHIFKSLKRHPEAGRTVVCLEGHGGGAAGMLPDRDDREKKATVLSVENLVKGTHDGLARFTDETGLKKSLGVMVLDSCLMGEFSVIDAFSKSGDVSVLVASPLTVTVEKDFGKSLQKLLGDSASSGLSDEEVGKKLVDGYRGAGAFGAYRLDEKQVKTAGNAIKSLFSKALGQPELFPALRMACDRLKTRNGDLDGCDIIQLAGEIEKDPSLASLHVEAREMSESVKKLIIAQHSPDPRGRSITKPPPIDGPSLYLPTHPSNWNEKRLETPFAKNTPEYRDFAAMLIQAGM
jgi:hypothetical protein